MHNAPRRVSLPPWIRPSFRRALLGAGCIAVVLGAWSASGGPKEPGGRQSQIEGEGRADQTRPRPSTLEIEQIILVDRRGRKRIQLFGDDPGPSITLFDGNGKKRLELRLEDAIPAVAMMDAKENALATIQLRGDEAVLRLTNGSRGTSIKPDGVFVQDGRGENRATLALLNDNFPVVGVSSSGQQGPRSIEMVAGDDGSRKLAVHDQRGFPLFSLFSNEKSSTYFNISHPQHQRSLQMFLGPKNEDGPTIACFAPDRPEAESLLPMLHLGLDRDAKPYFRMSDAQGKHIFHAP